MDFSDSIFIELTGAQRHCLEIKLYSCWSSNTSMGRNCPLHAWV